MKLLSIIIPTYNTEKYIERCLTSILQEEIVNYLEIIVVNDGSTDNSYNIAKKYKEKYPNSINIINKENGGHGSTINEGIAQATGKYLKIIDSDDWVNVDDFVDFVNNLKTLDVDLILTNYTRELIYNGSSILFKYSKKMEYNHIYLFNEFNFDLLGLDYFFMSTSTYKTDILKENIKKLDENTFYVDMEFNVFSILNVESFVYLNYDIYHYFIGRIDQSINQQSLVKNRKHHEKVLKRLIEYYVSANLNEIKNKYILNIISQMINTHYIIYCLYIFHDKKAKNELKEFDKFLKEKSSILYNVTNNYAYIRWNRRTKFIFLNGYKNWFTRLVNIYEYKVSYRNIKA